MKNETGIVHEVDVLFDAACRAQDLQNIKDQAERQARRMAAYKAWVDPEAMAKRKAEHEKEAASALELGKLAARKLEVLPVPDPLPPHMVGQSPATIQSMLRHERNKMKIGGGPSTFDDQWNDLDPQSLRAQRQVEVEEMAKLREDTKAKLAEMAKAKEEAYAAVIEGIVKIAKHTIKISEPYERPWTPEVEEPVKFEAPKGKGWLPWNWFRK